MINYNPEIVSKYVEELGFERVMNITNLNKPKVSSSALVGFASLRF
jgi:hypothetical protein